MHQASRLGVSASCLGLLALVGGACSQDCNAVGFDSMVRVSLPDATWVVTELCVDDVCVTADVVGSQMYVPVSSDSPSSYPYRLALTTPDGRDLQFSGTVKTERYRVNGPGCEPVTANAVLKVGADGQLTAGAEPDG